VRHVATALGFVWTLPNTVLGVLLGLFTFQRPRIHGGALVFDRGPRGLSWVMSRMHRSAMTLGFVILSAVPLDGTFIPAYFVLAVPFGYRRHPFERAARRAAGEPEA